MGRREFIAMAAAGGLASGCGPRPDEGNEGGRPCSGAVPDDAGADDGYAGPVPTRAQRVWQDCEVGLIYHFDLPIAASVFARNNATRRKLDPALYNPRRLDTDQWIEAATAAGARYAVFTATHFNGFMQWQSDLYPYGLKQAAWRDGKGDVVADFVKSCRKAGILPGIYFSTHRNVYWSVWGHWVDWGRGRGTEAQAKFNRIAEKMTEELVSRYGPLVQIWYDAGVKTPGEGGPDVLPVFERHQPDSIFYSSTRRADVRWIGNERGDAGNPCWATMPEGDGKRSHNAKGWKRLLHSGDPDGGVWSPGMVDVPLRGASKVHNWFWKPGQDHACHSTGALLNMYYRSVGSNCNFVVGEVVTPEGLVPRGDIDRLAEFGREVKRRFASPLAETGGRGTRLTLALPAPGRVDHAAIMEDIARGERIRRYRVEARVSGDEWRTLAEGQSVGHKRIERFEPVEAVALRLVVSDSTAEPAIRSFAAFDAGQ